MVLNRILAAIWFCFVVVSLLWLAACSPAGKGYGLKATMPVDALLTFE